MLQGGILFTLGTEQALSFSGDARQDIACYNSGIINPYIPALSISSLPFIRKYCSIRNLVSRILSWSG